MTTRPWPRGAASGLGSLPGTDATEALRTVLGEVPDLPYLPELPARGPGADVIGRTAAVLVDLPVELVPSGWRIAGRPGRDLRRARDLLARDLDAVAELASRFDGAFKFAAAGPWTLAAGLELPNGHRVVTDHGATRDLAESLAEGLRVLTADLAARMPAATLVGQLDEPSLPGVLAGTLPTASGWGTVRHVDRAVVRDTLGGVLTALPTDRVVHCCADAPPVDLFVEAGATAVAVDLATVDTATTDALGAAVDAGVGVLLGVVASTGDEPPTFAATRDRLTAWWSRLGFPAGQLADVVVPTPACGMAGATPAYARAVMGVLRDVGRAAAELS
ncbi:methionine synthase [Jatrophihabitans sp. YIM 134969]